MIKWQNDSLIDSELHDTIFLNKSGGYGVSVQAKIVDDQIDALAKSDYATDSKYEAMKSSIIKGKTFKELTG